MGYAQCIIEGAELDLPIYRAHMPRPCYITVNGSVTVRIKQEYWDDLLLFGVREQTLYFPIEDAVETMSRDRVNLLAVTDFSLPGGLDRYFVCARQQKDKVEAAHIAEAFNIVPTTYRAHRVKLKSGTHE